MDSVKRDYKDILIVILLIGILAMTIVYANFTRRLDIVSAGELRASDWNVHFENLVKSDSSTARVSSPAVILDGKTVISGLNITLEKPGDYIKYTFDIYNAGKMDARLDGFTHNNPECVPSSYICDNLIYTIKYTDESTIKLGDILKPGQRRNVTLIIKLSEKIDSMPLEKVSISDFSTTFYYVQK